MRINIAALRYISLLVILLFVSKTSAQDFGKPVNFISKDILDPYLGSVSEYHQINSKYLDYDVRFKVYVPVDYETLGNMPSIYLTDGPGYMNPQAGDMISKLDLLIGDKKIDPVIAIFIDQRDPDDPGVNRRNSEFFNNYNFLSFVTRELVPFIDENFKTKTLPVNRALMGLSFGGLNAAYFGVKAYNVFGMIGMQSPAFHPKPVIYDYYRDRDVLPIRIFLTTGNRESPKEGTRKMKQILEQKGYNFYYKEVPEKHNWKNWNPLIDDALVYFFGTDGK